MPVSFLSTTQRERYGRYPESLSADELVRHFHLDDDDREWIVGKRRDSSRLGYALQLTTVRFLGTFLEDPTGVPVAVLHTLSTQLGVADTACVFAYQLSALGLVVNMIVLWNTLHTDAVLEQLRCEGYPVRPEDEARLSPFGHEHINMLGRYSFAVPEAVACGELRPLGKREE